MRFSTASKSLRAVPVRFALDSQWQVAKWNDRPAIHLRTCVQGLHLNDATRVQTPRAHLHRFSMFQENKQEVGLRSPALLEAVNFPGRGANEQRAPVFVVTNPVKKTDKRGC